jgi:hypothetical protein
MRDNSGSGKGKNNLHDPTLRDAEEGRAQPHDTPPRKREDTDAADGNMSALGGHVATRSGTAKTPEEERSR